MMLSLRAVLLAALAAGLLHIDAQAQVPDRAALLPAATDAVEALPTETAEPVLRTTRHGEFTLETGRDGEIVLESGGATRREILSRLFAGREVQIEWRNKAFADERVQARLLRGSPVELARRLLARQSYVMSYDTSSNEPRLARIVILGSDPPSVTPSAGAPSPARREAGASEAARRRAAIDAARRAITAAQRR
jgi:hypothetical protein